MSLEEKNFTSRATLQEEKKRKALAISVGLTVMVIIFWGLTLDIPAIDKDAPKVVEQDKSGTFFKNVKRGFDEVKSGVVSLIGGNKK